MSLLMLLGLLTGPLILKFVASFVVDLLVSFCFNGRGSLEVQPPFKLMVTVLSGRFQQGRNEVNIGKLRVQINTFPGIAFGIFALLGGNASPSPVVRLFVEDVTGSFTIQDEPRVLSEKAMRKEKRSVLASIDTTLSGAERNEKQMRMNTLALSAVEFEVRHFDGRLHVGQASFRCMFEEFAFNAREPGEIDDDGQAKHLRAILRQRCQLSGMKLHAEYLGNEEQMLNRWSVKIDFQVSRRREGASMAVRTSGSSLSLRLDLIATRAVLAASAKLLQKSRFNSYRRLRPSRSPMQEPGKWWRHAIVCVFHEMSRTRGRLGWPPVDTRIGEMRKRRLSYVQLLQWAQSFGWLAPRAVWRLQELETQLPLAEQASFRWYVAVKKRGYKWCWTRTRKLAQSERKVAMFQAVQRRARGLSANPVHLPAHVSVHVHLPRVIASISPDGKTSTQLAVHSLRAQATQHTVIPSFFFPQSSRRRTQTASAGMHKVELLLDNNLHFMEHSIVECPSSRPGTLERHSIASAVECEIEQSPDSSEAPKINGRMAPLDVTVTPSDAAGINSLIERIFGMMEGHELQSQSSLADEVLRANTQGRGESDMRQRIAPSTTASAAPLLHLWASEILLSAVVTGSESTTSCSSDGIPKQVSKRRLNVGYASWDSKSASRIIDAPVAIVRIQNAQFATANVARNYELELMTEAFFCELCDDYFLAHKKVCVLDRVHLRANTTNTMSASPGPNSVLKKETNVHLMPSKFTFRLSTRAALLGSKLSAYVVPFESSTKSPNPSAGGVAELPSSRSSHAHAQKNSSGTSRSMSTVMKCFNISLTSPSIQIVPMFSSGQRAAILKMRNVWAKGMLSSRNSVGRFSIGDVSMDALNTHGELVPVLVRTAVNLSPEANSSLSARTALRCWRRVVLETCEAANKDAAYIDSEPNYEEEEAQNQNDHSRSQLLARVVLSGESMSVTTLLSFMVLRAELNVLKQLAKFAHELKSSMQFEWGTADGDEANISKPPQTRGKGVRVTCQADLRTLSVRLSVDHTTFGQVLLSDIHGDAEVSDQGTSAKLRVWECHVVDALKNAHEYKYILYTDAETDMLEILFHSATPYALIRLKGISLVAILRFVKDLMDFGKFAIAGISSPSGCDDHRSDRATQAVADPLGIGMTVELEMTSLKIHVPRHSWAEDRFKVAIAHLNAKSSEPIVWQASPPLWIPDKEAREPAAHGAVLHFSSFTLDQVVEHGYYQPVSRTQVIQPITTSACVVTDNGVISFHMSLPWMNGRFGERQVSLVQACLSENGQEKSSFGPPPVPKPNLPIGATQPGTKEKPMDRTPRSVQAPWLEVSLSVKDFSIDLDGEEPNCGRERRPRGPKLASLCGGGTQVQFQKGVDDSKALLVRAGEIAISDTRKESMTLFRCPHNRTFISHENSETSNAPCELAFYMGGEDNGGRQGSRQLEVTMNSATIVWPHLGDLSFIWELEKAFTHYVDCDTVEPFAREEGVPDKWTIVDVYIKDSKLFIPDISNCTTQRSIAQRVASRHSSGIKILLDDAAVGLHKGGDWQKMVYLDGHNLSSVVSRSLRRKDHQRGQRTKDTFEHSITLLEPTHMKVSIDKWATRSSENTDVQAEMDTIVLRACFGAANILRKMAKSLKSQQEQNKEQEAELGIPKQSRKHVAASLTSLECKVVDDRRWAALDILVARVSELTGSFRTTEESDGQRSLTSLIFECTVELEHLNSGIEDMQSVLKPWTMRSELLISRGKSSAEISLNDKVDAIFSPALLHSVGDALAFVKKITSSTSSKRDEDLLHAAKPGERREQLVKKSNRPALYHVVNNTGLSFTCLSPQNMEPLCFVDHSNARGVWLSLDTIEEKSTYLGDNTCVKVLAIVVQFNGGWMPTYDVIMNRVGRYVYRVYSPFHDITLPLLVDITLDGRVKRINLHSFYKLKNSCRHELMGKVYLQGNSFSAAYASNAKRTYETNAIPPGEASHLPIYVYAGGLLHVAVDDSEYAEKDVINLKASQIYSQQGICVCPSRDAASEPFSLSVEVDSKDVWRAGSGVPLQEYTITFRPHFAIKNLLPFGVEFEILDCHDQRTKTEFLDEGRTISFHDINFSHTQTIKITNFKGLCSSESLVVHRRNDRYGRSFTYDSDDDNEFENIFAETFGSRVRRQKLTLRKYDESADAYLDKLKIRVLNEFDRQSQRRQLILFTPYWFLNESYVPLDIKATAELMTKFEAKSAEPIPFSTNRNGLHYGLPCHSSRWSSSTNITSVGVKDSTFFIAHRKEAWKYSIIETADGILKPALGSTQLYVESQPPWEQELGKDETNDVASSMMRFDLGVDVRMGSGAFRNSKLVTVTPKYMLVNEAGFDIEFKQSNLSNTFARHLPHGYHTPWYWTDSALPFLLTLRPSDKDESEGEAWKFPAGLKLEKAGYFGLRVHPTSPRNKLVLPLYISMFRSSYIVRVRSPDKDYPPYRIRNKLREYKIRFGQKMAQTPWEDLNPGESTEYFWDDFQSFHRLRVDLCGHIQEVRLDVLTSTRLRIPITPSTAKYCVASNRLGRLTTGKGNSRFGKIQLLMTVMAEGPTRVLTIATVGDNDGAMDEVREREQLRGKIEEINKSLQPIEDSLNEIMNQQQPQTFGGKESTALARQSLDTIQSSEDNSGSTSAIVGSTENHLGKSFENSYSQEPKKPAGHVKQQRSYDEVQSKHSQGNQKGFSEQLVSHSRARSEVVTHAEPVVEETEEEEEVNEDLQADDDAKNQGQSMELQKLFAEGLVAGDLSVYVKDCIDLKKKMPAYAVVEVDDSIYTTKLVRSDGHPSWNEETEFRKVSSNNEMKVSVRGVGTLGETFLGQVFINLADIRETETSLQPELDEQSDAMERNLHTFTLSRRKAHDRVTGKVRIGFLWRLSDIDLLRLQVSKKQEELQAKEERLAAVQMKQNAFDDEIEDDRSSDFSSNPVPRSSKNSETGDNSKSLAQSEAERSGGEAQMSSSWRTQANEREAGELSLKLVEANSLIPPAESLATLHQSLVYAVVSCGKGTPKRTPHVSGSTAPVFNQNLTFRAAVANSQVFIRLMAKRRWCSDIILGVGAIDLRDYADGKPHYCPLKLLRSSKMREDQPEFSLFRNLDRKNHRKKTYDHILKNVDATVVGQIFVRLHWRSLAGHIGQVDDVTHIVQISLGGIGVTLLEEREDARRREIAYFNVSDVMVKGRKTPKESRVYLTVGTIQIDNQSLSSSIPVVVSRTTFMGESQRREKANFEDTLKKESDLQERPQLELSLVKLEQEGDLTYIKHFDFLLQSMDIELEEGFVNVLYNFVSTLPFHEVRRLEDHEESTDKYQRSAPVQDMLRSRVHERHEQQSRIYMEFFRIQPMQVFLTMRLGTEANVDKDTASLKIYRWTRAAGFPLVNLSYAPIRLNSFELADEFISKQDFMLKISWYYGSQAAIQLCKVGGGIELIQPAAGFVYGIGSGVRSFFYEPARGVVESPESARTRIGGAIGGIVRGTSELFKMSVFGAVDTFANFADTAGRGLAYVSMDRAYAHNMQSSRLYSYEASAQDYFLQGVRDVGRGFWGGVSGIIMMPIRGAERYGFRGFFTGCMKGFFGVALKPTSGMLQFAGKTLSGFRALGTGQSSHRAPKKRIKNPESFDNVGNMQSTAVDVGEWQKFLETCAAGKYTGEQVIDAVCTKRNRFAVFTDKRFLYCNVKGRRVKWSVVYARLSDISGGGQPCQVLIKERRRLKVCGGLPVTVRHTLTCADNNIYHAILFKLNAAKSQVARGESVNIAHAADVEETEEEEEPMNDIPAREWHTTEQEEDDSPMGHTVSLDEVHSLLSSVISLCYSSSSVSSPLKVQRMLEQAGELLREAKASGSLANETSNYIIEKLDRILREPRTDPMACARATLPWVNKLQAQECLLSMPPSQ